MGNGKPVVLCVFLLVMIACMPAFSDEIIPFNKYPGDLNSDGMVDGNDLFIFSGQWLQPGEDPNADIAPNGGDGIVNLLDFAVLANDWGQDSFAYSALDAARSGFEIMRYWLRGIEVPNTSNTSVKMSTVASKLQSKLIAAGVSNISVVYNLSNNTITIPVAVLDAATGQNFGAVIIAVDSSTLQASIIGSCGAASKQVVADFNFVTLGSGVFDFGIVTKGPLLLSGQADIGSTDLAVYANVYLEALGNSGFDLTMLNKASIAGDVSIADPYGTYSVSGDASVGGAQGSSIDEHIHIGVPPVAFPLPNPQHFLPYATGPEIASGTTSSHMTFDNAVIRAGSSVTFADDATINGILYIESPSDVTFAGRVTVNGVIAGDGEISDYDGISSLEFMGQVISHDVSTLTGSEFDAIRRETGTFICAPGFRLEFTGQYLEINGAVAGNGISFSGQSGGTINGSIIDYSKETMTMVSQSSLAFNPIGRDSVPSGFEPDQLLVFEPNSYSEYGMGLELSTSEFLIEQIREATAATPFSQLASNFNNKTFFPPRDSLGNVLANYPGYSQKITVGNLISFGPSTYFYKITVEIYLNGSVINSASWIRANY